MIARRAFLLTGGASAVAAVAAGAKPLTSLAVGAGEDAPGARHVRSPAPWRARLPDLVQPVWTRAGGPFP